MVGDTSKIPFSSCRDKGQTSCERGGQPPRSGYEKVGDGIGSRPDLALDAATGPAEADPERPEVDDATRGYLEGTDCIEGRKTDGGTNSCDDESDRSAGRESRR